MSKQEKRGETGTQDRFAMLFHSVAVHSSCFVGHSVSSNAKANMPTHLTHAFTALVSHSIAHRLTETIKVDWRAVHCDTSHVPAVTA